MTLHRLGKDPQSPVNESPTAYYDDRTGNYLLQGWKVTDEERLSQMDIPDHETVIEFPRRMMQFLPEVTGGTLPDFNELFHATQRTAVHLEMRDSYTRDKSFDDWQAGRYFDPADRWRSWYDLVRETTARGVEIRRARIVSEPVSQYIRFEHAVTDGLNIAAGEQVRWLPRRQATALALPGNDFWLFDNSTLLINHFAGDDSSRGAEILDDEDATELCGDAFETAWRHAIPHAEYRLV